MKRLEFLALYSTIEQRSKPFINLDKYGSQRFIDNNIIAEAELKQKVAVHHHASSSEWKQIYWRVEDLEMVFN